MLTKEFKKAKSPIIQYEGKTVALYDEIQVSEQGKLRIRFESSDSEWRQGFRIGDMSAVTDLKLKIGGQESSGMQLWQDSAPAEFEVEFSAPKGKIYIYNIWDNGNGQSSSQIMGAGMHVAEEGGVRHYRCNDGHPDVTFSHLHFTIEVV